MTGLWELSDRREGEGLLEGGTERLERGLSVCGGREMINWRRGRRVTAQRGAG